MSWFLLILSGVLEAVWATALGRSEGFTRPVPSVVFAVALAASMIGLALAVRDLPVGTAYAVWVGVGAVLTALVAVVTGADALTLAKTACLLLIVAGVVGLKALH